MKRKSETPSKRIGSGGRSPKLNNLISGGKKWSFEKTSKGEHVTHYDGPKGFNVTAPIIETV